MTNKFSDVDESTLSGSQYINILVGRLETPQVSYLYKCLPLRRALNSKNIAQAVQDADRSWNEHKLSLSFWCLMLQNVQWLQVQFKYLVF